MHTTFHPCTRECPLPRSFFCSYRASTLGVAAALCAGAGTPAPKLDRGETRAAVACVLGAERADHARSALDRDRRLALAAQRHARDMAERGFFAHVSPGGRSVLDRLRRTGYVGDTSVVVGEILARGNGRRATATSWGAAWMASPPHRAIVLDPRFADLGVGVARRGRSTFVAVTFGHRG